jgi:hypothetical protein
MELQESKIVALAPTYFPDLCMIQLKAYFANPEVDFQRESVQQMHQVRRAQQREAGDQLLSYRDEQTLQAQQEIAT